MMLKNATFFLLLMAGVAVFALFGAFFLPSEALGTGFASRKR